MLVLHSIRQMVVVYQNKIQFVCYEEGFSNGQFKEEASSDVQSNLPLAHDFTFDKVAGETQALKWHGVNNGGGPGNVSRVVDTKHLQFSSSDEDEESFFNSNQSQRAVEIVRTAKDKMLPQ